MNSINSNNVSTQRQDVYSRVTAKVIADLEQGVRPWMKPWSGGSSGVTLPLRHNGAAYRGINILLLWGEMIAKGYASAKWMTYRQAQELGGQVRKGEHGSLVVFADRFKKTEADENGQGVEREIPFMKGYTVFNVEQIEGLPESYYDRPAPKGEKMQLIEDAEVFFAATGAVIQHGGSMAFYAPSQDIIRLPVPEAFRDAESYAATKAHELTHWTAHEGRLARTLGKRFGDDAYAAEELVAELGSAFLCSALGITPEVREDHAAYLDHWLKVVKADRKAIFTAAAHAQRAVDYLHGLQQQNAVAA
jgi:antirestriction protein ArdC